MPAKAPGALSQPSAADSLHRAGDTIPRSASRARPGTSSSRATRTTGWRPWPTGRGGRGGWRTGCRCRWRRRSWRSDASIRAGGRASCASCSGAAAGQGGSPAGALDDPRGARPPRPGRACACPPPEGGGHAARRAGLPERALVLRLQGRVPPRRRPALLPAHRHRPGLALHPDGGGAGGHRGSPCLHGVSSPLPGARPAPPRSASDNGVPFATRSLYGLSRLAVWLLRLGIAHRADHPWQAAAERPPRAHAPHPEAGDHPARGAQQPRPAGALRRLRRRRSTPSARTRRSPCRPRPAAMPPRRGPSPACPNSHTPSTISTSSPPTAARSRSTVTPSSSRSVFGGQRLGLREVDNDVWLVSFMHYDLGYIDLEDCKLQTIDTPFGSRVSLI